MYERTEITPEQRQTMFACCERLRAQLGDRPRTACVDTYGCQQNESDSEILRGWLTQCGYRMTDDPMTADVVVVNTCAVRHHAEMRVLGNVGALVHARSRNPDMIVCVGGCMAQQEGMKKKLKESFRMVDLVFGPHELWQFPQLLEETIRRHGLRGDKGRLFAAAPCDGVVAEELPRQRDGSIKAWLSIMNGCNNFCTYCIVPYVRGRERSREPSRIEDECRELVRAGYRDITLLGQNVNSYGRGLDEKVDFPALLRRLDRIEGEYILRFMTSHPKDATEALFAAMAECEHTAHHIHLPLQSGSDRVLKAMNRHYDMAAYLEKVRLARQYMPDLVLTTDIIVGFPGETREEFDETLRAVEQVGFDAMFTFIYSPREGTPAAAMPDPVTRAEKQVWFDELTTLANRISAQKHAAYPGRTVRVLVDGKSGSDEWPLTSRTRGGRLVHLKGDESLIGTFADARITEAATWALFGEAL